jgi:type I restriction enzyme S subunit
MIADLKLYPRMKDSGVPWLGEMPEHWGMERAKWLFRKMDRPVRDSDEVVTCFRDGVVTLRKKRRVRGFTESLKEIGYQGIRRGDLVIHAMDAFAGAIGVSDSDGKGTPVYSVCEPAPGADAHYYAYTVREMARSQWIQALAKGIRERSTDFRFDGFSSETVPLPPLPEQAAIVRFLDHADRRIRRYIRAKEKLIKLLEEQKQAIIHRAVTNGLDPNIRLKPSGVEWLGDMPEHWEIRRLKTLVMQSVAGPYGSSLTKAMYTQVGYRVYGQQQVIPDDFSIGDYYISEEKYEEMSQYRVFPGDVLVSVMGTVGRVGVVPESVEPGIINPRLVRYRPNLEKVRPRYLQMAMLSTTIQAQVAEGAKGTTMEGLNMQILDRLLLAVPPLVEQDTIFAAVGAEARKLDEATRAVSQGVALLREYRTRLIADVVTGKLDVREAAARLPEESEEMEPLDETEALTDAEEGVVDDLDAAPAEAEA